MAGAGLPDDPCGGSPAAGGSGHLRHLPAVVQGLADGRLSWSQAVGIARAARDCPAARRGELDAIITGVLDEFRAYEPDELVDRVWLTVAGWAPSRLEQEQAAAERGEHLTLMPRLFDGGAGSPNSMLSMSPPGSWPSARTPWPAGPPTVNGSHRSRPPSW